LFRADEIAAQIWHLGGQGRRSVHGIQGLSGDPKGVRYELPSCSMTGEAALHQLDVGADVELLYGGPIPAAKKQSSGIGRATVAYAMRVVNVTGWMGAEVADITGAMAWELWKAAGIFLALTPVLALGTFFAAGVGGLVTLWHCIQAVRGAMKLSSVSEVREAIARASRELDAHEPAPGSSEKVAAAVPTR